MFPPAEINPPVNMFPTVAFPVAEIVLVEVIGPVATKFTPVMLPPALIEDITLRFAPKEALPVVVRVPVITLLPVFNVPALTMFPALTVPATDRAVRVPTAVMLACTALVTLPAVLANPGVTEKFASS
jgi:hypothetical protein